MLKAYWCLKRLEMPALIVQGDGDPKVAPVSGPALYRRIGSTFKRYVEVHCQQHGIVRGEAAPQTLAAVTDFLAEVA
jgi:esterase/lipase